jgi:glycosyltransferase involved in cell wall biosynthesis
VPWVLGEGEAGSLVDVRQPTAIAQAILGLLGDDARRAAVGARGFAHARQHFSTTAVIDRYLDAYRAALGRQHDVLHS